MRFKIIDLLVALSLWFCINVNLIAQEQEPGKLTLRQCIDFTMQNNDLIKANHYRVKGASAKLGQAFSFYFPQFTAQAGYTVLDKDKTSTITLPSEYYDLFVFNYLYLDLKRAINRGELSTWGYNPGTDPVFLIDQLIANPESLPQELVNEVAPYYGDAKRAIPQSIESGYLGGKYFGTTLSIMQPVFTGGKISGRYQQAGWNRSLEKHKEAEANQAIILQVCQTYFALSQGREMLELANEMQSRFKMLKIITKALMSNHKSRKNKYDYMTIKVYANKIVFLKQEVENKFNNGKALMQLLTGQSQQIDIKGNTQTPAVVIFSYEDTLRLLKNKNHTWQQLEQGKLIAEKEIAIAKAELFPDIGITGDYTMFYEEPDYGYMQEQSWSVMIGAKWHFPLGLQTLEAIKEKKADYEAVKKEINYAQKALETKVKTILADIQNSKQQLTFMENIINDAKERSRLAIEGYRVEEVGTKELIEAQNEESETRIQYLQTLFNYQKQLLEYVILTGEGLNEVDYLD